MAAASGRAQGLVVGALLCVLGLAAWYGRTVWADSGPFALILFGAPMMCAAVALWAERTVGSMLAPAFVAALAVVSLSWSLLTALGIGLVFVVPSFLLLVAAMASRLHRTGRDPSASLRN